MTTTADTGYTQISYSVDGGVARLVLNRPHYRNAQSRILREEMDSAFAAAEKDDSVHVLVLSGAGDHFSSGHDLGTPEEMADRENRPRKDGVHGRYEDRWDLNVANTFRWRDFPKPTIAQVQGYCIYGGWLIASAMDIIVASDDAKFLPSLVQYFSIPWDMHIRQAKEILFTRKFISAEKALEIGFVNHVVPRSELESTTNELAATIAEQDIFSLRMLKEAINSAQDAQGFRHSIRTAFAFHMLKSEDEIAQAGLADYSEKRRMRGVGESLRTSGL
jgi:enoyl-CoA hydratase